MADPRRLSRRDLIRTTAATVAGVGLPLAVSRVTTARGHGPPAADSRPTSIVFMVSDGMSAGVPTLAEPFSRLARGRGTTWHQLAADPRTVHGLADMGSLDSLVTDSAAASSSWGSGSRVFNGAINRLPDGTALTPIGPLARRAGRAVGLVTTCTVTHATPAGFAAVQQGRDHEHDIAPQYLNVVDVILGGGSKHYSGRLRQDQRDLWREFKEQNYDLWRSRHDLLQAKTPTRALGLFAQSHLPYTIDHQRDETATSAIPTLAEMTRAALAILGNSPGGFLLQVEGGRVDHAAHANDAAALLWEQLAFDDAIAVVLEFQQSHPDMLVVITTDHGNSNPGLNGMGAGYRQSDACFARLTPCAASYAVMGERLRKAADGAARASADSIIEVIRAATRITISTSDAQSIAAALDKEPLCELNQQHANIVGALGQVLGNHTGIGWTGTTHTADLAMLMAVGPGAERFAGLTRNIDVYTILADLMGITHRNPGMTPAEARKFASTATHSDLHWV